MTQTDSAAGAPFIRVLRGNPTPEEIAAVVVALLGQDRLVSDHPAVHRGRRGRRRSSWADPARTLRLHAYHRPH
jgi:hypothetical protein